MNGRLTLVAVAVTAGVVGGSLPYGDFAQRHHSHAHPVSAHRIKVELRDVLASRPPLPLGLSGRELRARVADALNIRFLLDPIGTDPIGVSLRERHAHSVFTEDHLVLEDDALGSLDVTLLVPNDGLATHPAVVGLHGHGDHASDFIRHYMGAELAREGYLVIVPWSRAMDCGAEEQEVSLHLLREGFTLMGIRVYETLVAIRYLSQRADVDPQRIAILGHSGGSSTANLVLRVTDRLTAGISDHAVDYRDLCEGRVHCETVPALFTLAADINDPRTLAIPYLSVPYGFVDAATRRRILGFLAQSLHHHPAQARAALADSRR